MSRSETGINVMTTTTNIEPVTAVGVLQKTNGQRSVQNMRLAFSADGTAIYKPFTTTPPSYQPPSVAGGDVGSEASVGGSQPGQGLNMNVGSEQMKKKRGRPRKHLPDGDMSLALVPFPSSAAGENHQSGGGFSSSRAALAGGSASPNSIKKSRGRPPGSGRKHQLEALGSAGIGFTPHVITVKPGEDVSSKIMSFSQHGGPRAVCILSANGAILNVTLRQTATSGGAVTYEGRFEILSLSGSFLLSENGGQRSRTGGLSVSLSGPDGRVLGGSVAGLLTAATPVQVIVGSFIADDGHGHGRKISKSFHKKESSVSSPKIASGSVPAGASSPPSCGTLSESSGGPRNPLNQSTGACNNNHQQGMTTSIPWK